MTDVVHGAPGKAGRKSRKTGPRRGGGSILDRDAAKRARATSEPDEGAARQRNRGRHAETPAQIPPLGWKDILWRLWDQFNEDRVLLVAAGAAFYLLLALFPALAAFVSIYGLIADPMAVADHLWYLASVIPPGGIDIIRAQLLALAHANNGALGFRFFLGMAIALWSANSGVKALFDAMNIAYEESEKRSFLRLNLLSLGFTAGAMMFGIGMLLAVGVVPLALAFLRLDSLTETLISASRWPILALIALAATTLLYRYGPSREKAKWRWLSWGAVLATLVWGLASFLFSLYLQNFADYNATYGSLGAAIGLMMWTWISVVILIVGAAVNAEMEHQTARDTTTGAPRPMGERGAFVADTLGKAAD